MGFPKGFVITPIEERFWSKVNKTPTCWLWTGGKSGNGYGKIWYKGSPNYAAHRLSYELNYGPIKNEPNIKYKDQICVLHKCDTPACVNPDHLFLGSFKDNALDKIAKGRNPDYSGTKNPAAKYSPEFIRAVLYNVKIARGGRKKMIGKGQQLRNAFNLNVLQMNAILQRYGKNL